MEADGDKVNVATRFPPTPDTDVDNTEPTSGTVVDNSSPAPVDHVNNYDPAASTTNQPLPQKIAMKVNRDKTNPKALHIAIGIADIDSVDLSISFDFSSLKNQIDSTTVDNNSGAEGKNPLIVPIGGEKINSGGPAKYISSGGGGKTH